MIQYVVTFCLGLAVGSFLNVAIFRTHERRSVITGRSKCGTCEEPISPKDLIPVFSYIALRGRCRKCKSVISWQYPVVELATGVLFLLFHIKYKFGLFMPFIGPTLDSIFPLLTDWALLSFLIIIFVYDLRHMAILDRFTVPAMIVAIILNMWLGIIPIESILLGAVVFGGFFYAQFALSRGTWVGGGDVRMGVLLGLMLGFSQGFVALFIAYLLGALSSVILLILKKANRKTPVPFGTFMAIGAAIMLFFQNAPLDWYLGLFI